MNKPTDLALRGAEELAQDIADAGTATLTSAASLQLNPTASIQCYCGLIRTLWRTSEGSTRLSTMTKFLIGDALNQGEDLYGEEAAQVYGTDLPWDKRTVDNIRWTAQNIPPDCRRLHLSFRFFQDIAALPRETVLHYVAVAEKFMEEDPLHYRKKTLDLINEDRCRSLLAGVANEEARNKFTTLWMEHQPHWNVLKDWIDGRELPPMRREQVDDWVDARIGAMRARSEEYGKLKFDVLLREVLAPALVELATGMKRGWIQAKKDR